MTTAALSPRPPSGPGRPQPSGALFADLPRRRCVDLLGEHTVGRIAWQAADGPQLYPVSYAWCEDRVVFRTSPYGALSELVRSTEVVFEIDELDHRRRTGWSIVVKGRASAIAAPERLAEMEVTGRSVPWAEGTRDLVIGVTPHQITGRRFDRDRTDGDD
jgi:uncharacterized protein